MPKLWINLLYLSKIIGWPIVNPENNILCERYWGGHFTEPDLFDFPSSLHAVDDEIGEWHEEYFFFVWIEGKGTDVTAGETVNMEETAAPPNELSGNLKASTARSKAFPIYNVASSMFECAESKVSNTPKCPPHKISQCSQCPNETTGQS